MTDPVSGLTEEEMNPLSSIFAQCEQRHVSVTKLIVTLMRTLARKGYLTQLDLIEINIASKSIDATLAASTKKAKACKKKPTPMSSRKPPQSKRGRGTSSGRPASSGG